MEFKMTFLLPQKIIMMGQGEHLSDMDRNIECILLLPMSLHYFRDDPVSTCMIEYFMEAPVSPMSVFIPLNLAEKVFHLNNTFNGGILSISNCPTATWLPDVGHL